MKSEKIAQKIAELFAKWSELVNYRTKTGKPVKAKMREARVLSLEFEKRLKMWRRLNVEDMKSVSKK